MNKLRILRLWAWWGGCLLSIDLFTDGLWAANIEYNRDIRPILADQCFSCHGPDQQSRQADLRLDEREAAIAAGAIVAGRAMESELMRRILSEDPELLMPPPESHKHLTDAQKSLLRQWLDEGAVYQPHWSFVPPALPALPTVRDPAWIRQPWDSFILAELDRRGLAPNPEADLRTLVRRVALDLTGLPPTPAEVEVVLNDPNPDRYERYVEQLLQRPSWGEHRARYWMDYARYGDTHGIHFDNYREMYSFRDWVIGAFNRNLPFDRFTVEQLAGDLLPNADLSQQIASGFHRCNITTNEGGIIDEEYAVLYARDRVETTATVWMGLTAGCAVCHDHKFDPLTQREFYQLAAFFNNTTQNVRDGNIQDTPPIIRVPLEEDRAPYLAIIEQQKLLTKKLDELRQQGQAKFDRWRKDHEPLMQDLLNSAASFPPPWLHLPLMHSDTRWLTVMIHDRFTQLPLAAEATLVEGHLSPKAWRLSQGLRPTIGGLGPWEGQQPLTISFQLHLGEAKHSGSLLGCFDTDKAARGWEVALTAGKLVVQWAEQTGRQSLRFVADSPLPIQRWQSIAIAYDGTRSTSSLRVFADGKMLAGKVTGAGLSEKFRAEGPFRLGGRPGAKVADQCSLQDIRLYRQVLPVEELSSIVALSRVAYLTGKAELSAGELDEICSWYFANLEPEYQAIHQVWMDGERQRQELEARGTIAHVMAEKPEPPKAYVLMRGEYDKRGEEVTPDTPRLLPPMPAAFPRNRLGLAQWLVMPEHPLTARVTVNRFWQELFGQGLVASASDFGLAGSQPVNQELLDYLAVNFSRKGWNVKDLFFQIVTSATYRQSSLCDPPKLAIDPYNQWLSRGPRFRMDGEMVRDYALKVSGLLATKIGGKSVRPYQPPGVWEAVAMPNSNTKAYQEDQGESLYRRSLYTFWKRAAPPASMEIFNAPTREVCTVRRERTNTPLQALVTMNDPQFVEAARCLAERLLHASRSDDPSRIQWLAEQVLGRPLRASEMPIVSQGLVKLRQHYAEKPEEANALLQVGLAPRDPQLDTVEHAAWTLVAHQLFNLDETLCK